MVVGRRLRGETAIGRIARRAVPLTEIRRPEFADTIEDLSREEQDELAQDLVARVTPTDDLTAPASPNTDRLLGLTGTQGPFVLTVAAFAIPAVDKALGRALRGHP